MRKYTLTTALLFLSLFVCAQTTNPTPTVFTNGLLPPVKSTAPILSKGSLWYDTVADGLKFYNGSSWLQISTSVGTVVNSVFGRTGVVTALSADYSSFYPLLSGSYANPSWITSLPWSKITSPPTTLAGYGITDAYPLTGNPSGFLTSFTEVDPFAIKLTGTQTFSGFKKTSSMIGFGTASGTGFSGVNSNVPVFDLSNGLDNGMVVGADASAQTRTDATTKVFRLGGAPYTIANIPTGVFYVQNTSTENVISYGGGTSGQNAATRHSFFVGATTSTPTGTETFRIVANGVDLRSGRIGVSGSFGSAGQSLRNNTGNTGLEFYTPNTGTVTSFGKTDGYGITSSVANSTTTPVHTIAADTSLLMPKVNTVTLAQLQTRLNAYTPITRTVAGFALSSNVTLGSMSVGYGLLGANYNGSSNNQWNIDTTSATALVSKSRLASNLGGYVTLATDQTLSGRKKFTSTLILDSGSVYLKPITIVPAQPTGWHSFSAVANGFIYRANSVSQALSFTIPSGGTGATWQTGTGTVAWTSDLNSFVNYTANGTGAATTIVIPHGLSGISGTSKVIVQPLNSASAGVQYATIDATNVNVMYTVAPVIGSSNLSYSILIKP